MRKPLILIFLVSIIGAATLSGVAAHLLGTLSPIDMTNDPCPNQIVNFKNSVNWYRGKNRMVIEAALACSSKFGDSYELTDVRLNIVSGNRLITQVHSDSGSFWPKNNEILISKTDHGNKKGCLKGFDLLVVNIKTGELRTPGLRNILNSEGLIQCKQGYANG